MARGKLLCKLGVAASDRPQNLKVLLLRNLKPSGYGERELAVGLDVSVHIGENLAQHSAARGGVYYRVKFGIELLKMLGVVFLYIILGQSHALLELGELLFGNARSRKR